MKSIDELEREIGLQIRSAQEGKEPDWAKVTALGMLGQDLKKVKKEIERIEKAISHLKSFRWAASLRTANQWKWK